MTKYGSLPVSLGIQDVKVEEMFFYQYLPIKLEYETTVKYEDRLKNVFHEMVCKCIDDFKYHYGYKEYFRHNIYLTAKHQYQTPGKGVNRPGWHSDGFLTNDINYIWSNNTPTIFYFGDLPNMPLEHESSLVYMQYHCENYKNIAYADNELLKLNQYNIHKCGEILTPGMRCFFKLSFSPERYNLIGNAHNNLLDYNWPMYSRQEQRNHPIKGNSDTFNLK